MNRLRRTGFLTLILGLLGAAAVALRKGIEMIRQHAYDQAIEQANLERTRFLQRLDHELKNPLTAIQIALTNLEEVDDADKRREIRSSMRGQIVRINHLIGDLRKLAQLERVPIEEMPVDVRDMLDETAQMLRDGAEALNRRVVVDLHLHDGSLILGDRDLLQLALYNLIDNAFKFTSPGDQIILHARVESDELVIQIRDTGRGIQIEDQPHVWEDLYRGRDAHGIPGSGIGLAMVRGIIERHGGEAEIESEPGAGTTVTLRLPQT